MDLIEKNGTESLMPRIMSGRKREGVNMIRMHSTKIKWKEVVEAILWYQILTSGVYSQWVRM